MNPRKMSLFLVLLAVLSLCMDTCTSSPIERSLLDLAPSENYCGNKLTKALALICQDIGYNSVKRSGNATSMCAHWYQS